MANYDLVNNIDTQASIVAQTITADTNGSGVDLAGYLSSTAIISLGAEGPNLSANISITFKLQDSDDDATWTGVAVDDALGIAVDADGIFYVADKAAAAPEVIAIGYTNTKRYLRVVVEVKGAQGTGTPISALIVRGHPKHRGSSHQRVSTAATANCTGEFMSRKIVMLKDTSGASNEMGSKTRIYKRDETLSLDQPWQVKLAEAFLSIGAAIEHDEQAKPSKKTSGFLSKIGKKIS